MDDLGVTKRDQRNLDELTLNIYVNLHMTHGLAVGCKTTLHDKRFPFPDG